MKLLFIIGKSGFKKSSNISWIGWMGSTYYRLKSNHLLFLQDTLSSLHKEKEDRLSMQPPALIEIIEDLEREILTLMLRLEIAIQVHQEAGIPEEEIEKRVREILHPE